MSEKLQVVSNETEALQAECEAVTLRGQRELADLRGQVEAAEAELEASQRQAYEFKRDVLGGPPMPGERPGKPSADKVMRFLNGQAAQQAEELDKLRLKELSLKASVVSLGVAKAQKEEAGDELQPVDLEALRIEGTHRLERVQERTAELLRLKKSSGAIQRSLLELKTELGNLTAQCEGLRGQQAGLTAQMGVWQAECGVLEAQRAEAERKYRTLERQHGGDNPLSIDYIHLKAEVAELEKKAVDWERKVEIAEMESSRKRRAAATRTDTSGGAGSRTFSLAQSRTQSNAVSREPSRFGQPGAERSGYAASAGGGARGAEH